MDHFHVPFWAILLLGVALAAVFLASLAGGLIEFLEIVPRLVRKWAKQTDRSRSQHDRRDGK